MENTQVKSGIDYRIKAPNQTLQVAMNGAPPVNVPKPRLLDQVREAIRTRHYSYRTEKAYVHWIKRFIFFHNKRHPLGMGEAEIGRFLSSLATDSHVSASTQNQALNALLFLYKEVLGKTIGLIQGVVRAKRSKRLPVVLTKEEVEHILDCLEGTQWLMAVLLYAAGLRLLECCHLESRISTFRGIKLSFAPARATKTAIRCCRRWSSNHFENIS